MLQFQKPYETVLRISKSVVNFNLGHYLKDIDNSQTSRQLNK